ncbi:hypothetical protein [Micromonospora aurantiaca (nom. illeg.)]|uniref:hypothetical protein n=1 Tax=Micromonospora aurantiaca (nom. illeg.) TaxID=47850 RepID=UPI0008276488|nr:hypothetical protein [Micromonospora aurantiaca]SCL42151.1 hypothetical protein GA0070615_5324 [Micromonospora aurantiaca]
MNWRQFTVALVQALAWPSVALVVLLVYRRRVARLLGDNLRRLTVGPIEAEWERVAEETRATIEVAEALLALEETDGEQSLIERQLGGARAFIPVSPSAAIALGGQASQMALEAYLPMDDEELSKIPRLRPLLRRARERGLINPGAALVFEHLQRLRNLASHPGPEDPARTAEQAEEYLQMVEEFIALLEKPSRAAGRSLPSD